MKIPLGNATKNFFSDLQLPRVAGHPTGWEGDVS
jgi:hypothetical protein